MREILVNCCLFLEMSLASYAGPWTIPGKHSDPENDYVTADIWGPLMGLVNYKATGTYALLVSSFDFLCETD